MEPVTLTVSSQGQITIPKAWRKILDLKPGTKLVAEVKKEPRRKKLVLEPEPESWAKLLAGTGKGLWGNSDRYIKKIRESWDR